MILGLQPPVCSNAQAVHPSRLQVGGFQDEEWMPVNTSGGVPSSPSSSSTPQSRFFAAGGSPASGSSIGLLWLAMGQNEVGRKLGESWVLTINETQPNTGEQLLYSGHNQHALMSCDSNCTCTTAKYTFNAPNVHLILS